MLAAAKISLGNAITEGKEQTNLISFQRAAMDDTQDKVRRNLVVFSATIIISWFLELKLSAIAKLFIETDVASVNVGKLWIVTILVLLYLFLRFWFDHKTTSQLGELQNEFVKLRVSYINKYLVVKIAKINRAGKFLSVFESSLENAINQKVEELKALHAGTISFCLTIPSNWIPGGLVSPHLSNRYYSGSVEITEEYNLKDFPRNPILSTGQRHSFSIPRLGRVWVRTHALTHALLYSKSAIDFVAPLVLFVFALFISIFKLSAQL